MTDKSKILNVKHTRFTDSTKYYSIRNLLGFQFKQMGSLLNFSLLITWKI